MGIGMSDCMNVMSMLEKRIRSRFSMRHLHTLLPTSMADLTKVLMTRFHLPATCGLNKAFIKEFHRNVESALFAKQEQWQHHLEMGKPPSWFMWQCLPLTSLLNAATDRPFAASTAPPAKRARLGLVDSSDSLASTTIEDARALLIGSLSEAEHVLLLAFWRLRSRQEPQTLARALHEVQRPHESGSFVSSFVQDRYCRAFEALVQNQLLLVAPGSTDVSRRHLPCDCPVDSIYGALVRDLEKTDGQAWNPLRVLPQAVQLWAARQR